MWVGGEGATKSHPWGGWGGGRKHRDLETVPGFLRCSVQRWEPGYLGRGKLDLGLEGGGQTAAGVSGSLGSSGLGPGTSGAGYSNLHPILSPPPPQARGHLGGQLHRQGPPAAPASAVALSPFQDKGALSEVPYTRLALREPRV